MRGRSATIEQRRSACAAQAAACDYG
jgi:hypothetical protein